MVTRRGGRRRRKGWAAAGPQRPAYSRRGISCRHAHLVVLVTVVVVVVVKDDDD